jgi:hypothetical protein
VKEAGARGRIVDRGFFNGRSVALLCDNSEDRDHDETWAYLTTNNIKIVVCESNAENGSEFYPPLPAKQQRT